MYEALKVSPDFPIIFHKNTLIKNLCVSPHWHEHMELLHILNGKGKVIIGTEENIVEPGDTIVINPNAMHQIVPFDDTLVFYCLIIGNSLLDNLSLDISSKSIKSKITDANITALFSCINRLYDEKPVCYKPEICGNAIKIVSLLMRKHLEDNSNYSNKNADRAEMVKSSISYMKKNFKDAITLDDIAKHVGFNKCYFCRVFKEVTGVTVITMLNTIRCEEAKHLFASSKYNISEVAEKCGFSNTSYFTKTYKKIIGHLPSYDIKKQKITE